MSHYVPLWDDHGQHGRSLDHGSGKTFGQPAGGWAGVSHQAAVIPSTHDAYVIICAWAGFFEALSPPEEKASKKFKMPEIFSQEIYLTIIFHLLSALPSEKSEVK